MEATTDRTPMQNPWDEPISPSRQQELGALLAAKTDRPFAGKRLTGADVFFLACRVVAGPRGDLDKASERLRQAAHDRSARGAIHLDQLDLRGADLFGAHLESAVLPKALMDGASLRSAHLDHAILAGARLRGATFPDAHLAHTDLTAADLKGADLRSAHFTKSTRLNNARIGGAILDHGFVENASLNTIEWMAIRQLGNESLASRLSRGRTGEKASPKPMTQRIYEYRAASRVYRSLAQALRTMSYADTASRFRYRGLVMERKGTFWQAWRALGSGHPLGALYGFGRWLLSLTLGAFTGYGENLGRLVVTYLVALGGFTTAFMVAGGKALNVENVRMVLLYTILVFHGRGAPSADMSANPAVVTIAGVAGITGLLIEGLLIGVITAKLLRD